jgi:hypothetical protein
MKTCPFKHYELGEPMLIKNVNIDQSVADELRHSKPALIKIQDGSDSPSIEPLYAACNESDCAIWDVENYCCSFRRIK